MKTLMKCDYCNKEYLQDISHLKYKTHYCSRKCKGLWMSKNKLGKNAINYKHGESEGSKFNCINCNKKGIRKAHKQKYCSTQCQLNYEYKTGIRDKYKTTMKAHEALKKGNTYQNFRKRVFNFYPNQCAMCGSKEKLEAHHIIPQKYEGRKAKGIGDQRVRNGIILCHKCHMYKFSDEYIKKAFELYSKNNNLRLTSRISKISKSTLINRFKKFL
jgi:hypothetical protein